MSQNMSEMLAQAVVKAARIREESYDHEAANKAIAEAEAKNKASLNFLLAYSNTVDFNKFYKLSIKQAANKACELVGFDTRMAELVSILLYCTWNDTIDWARKVSQDVK